MLLFVQHQDSARPVQITDTLQAHSVHESVQTQSAVVMPVPPVPQQARRLADPFAWLTAMTAVVAIYIAYQQHRTARGRLRLDLYDRRMKVFEALTTFIDTIVTHADVSVQQIAEYSLATRPADFLFKTEAIEYLHLVRKNGVRLRTLQSKLHEEGLPLGAERIAAAEEDGQLLSWFLAQQTESVKHFTPYLDFRKAY